MTAKPITIFTVIHFLLAVVMMFLALGAVLGLGFKDQWSILDHVYYFVTINGMKLLTFPVWIFMKGGESELLSYLWIPAQLVVSFVQVNLVVFMVQWVKIRNKSL